MRIRKIKIIKCNECKGRIYKGKEKYIDTRKVCKICFNNLKEEKYKKENWIKCKYKGCPRGINSKNSTGTGYCLTHWHKMHDKNGKN